MKIGFPNNPKKDIVKEVEWIGQNGFDFVDLFLEPDMAVPEKIDTGKLKGVLEKHGLGTVGHTAWYLPIYCPVKVVRDATVEELKRNLPVHKALGVKAVTVHTSWYPGRFFSSQECVNFQVEALKEMVKEGEKHGIKIMLEHGDTEHDTVENLRKILDAVPGLYFHLDTGHANLHGRSVVDFIEAFPEKLVHVHVHDNDSSTDQHRPIGMGTIDWETVIRALKKQYDGTITLEIFAEKELVLKSKKKLRGMWDSV
jgi:sugar phosphate isomerase/epimerase